MNSIESQEIDLYIHDNLRQDKRGTYLQLTWGTMDHSLISTGFPPGNKHVDYFYNFRLGEAFLGMT